MKGVGNVSEIGALGALDRQANLQDTLCRLSGRDYGQLRCSAGIKFGLAASAPCKIGIVELDARRFTDMATALDLFEVLVFCFQWNGFTDFEV